jgi:hypothetical protein
VAESSWPATSYNSGAVNMSEYEQIGRYAVHGDGLIGSPADTALVYADGAARQVMVRASRYATMWGHVWTSGPTELILSITANSSGSTRVDLVVLELARASGAITAKVVAGTPGAGAPSITSNSSIHQFALAQVTVTNGATVITAGNVSMVARLTRPVLRQVFTATGTWTKPVGARMVFVQVVGGGGAGGGAATAVSGEHSFGSGGGGGAYADRLIDADSVAASVTATVGTGGVAVSGADGGDGGASSFGTYVGAGGGGGGKRRVSSSSAFGVASGVGGTSSTGTPDIVCAGGPGTTGFGSGILAFSGSGGNSLLGGGGAGLSSQSAGGSSTGSVGGNYGGGGGGGLTTSTGTLKPGGTGGPGLVIVTTYF